MFTKLLKDLPATVEEFSEYKGFFSPSLEFLVLWDIHLTHYKHSVFNQTKLNCMNYTVENSKL